MSSTPRFNRLGAIAGAVALVALGTIGFGQFNRPAQADAGPATPPPRPSRWPRSSART